MTKTEHPDVEPEEHAASGCAPESPWPAAPPGVFWDVITKDAGCAVLVMNERGIIDFANATAAAALDPGAGRVAGRPLSDFVARTFVEERLSLCHRVMESGRPIVVIGMSHGNWGRTTIRPLERDSAGLGRVLVTRPVPAGAGPAQDDSPAVHAKTADMGRLSTCTPRELEVLRLIGFGLSTPDIAARLFRSVKTIETHRVSLGHKLGVHNRVELARLAIDAGLTQMSDRETADFIRHDEPRPRDRAGS